MTIIKINVKYIFLVENKKKKMKTNVVNYTRKDLEKVLP